MAILARIHPTSTNGELNSTHFTNFKMLVLAGLGGIVIGSAVASIRKCVGLLQTYLFGTNINLYNAANIPPGRILLVTILGGFLLGGLLMIANRYNRLAIVDPVEANALEGGRMSLFDSIILVGLSSLSITIGGSVGFEAAMTQLGAGLLSSIGQRLNLSRRELRILVSCGTGAGIAAIFGAPLAGTFYALELVIGGYAMRALMPTLLASALSSLVIYNLIGYKPLFPAFIVDKPIFWHFPLAIFIGVTATMIGILVMRGTTSFEQLLKKANIPLPLRPVIGSLLLGLIAIALPQVMGPGHYDVNEILAGRDWIGNTGIILFVKIAASIACVGSGFRGGLFSASLFFGASLGCIIHQLIVVSLFDANFPLDLSVVAGMAGVTASIIGTPIAAVLLMMETAGLNAGIITTAITVIVASQLTRHWFGFSFSTWRFHIKGAGITGPRDIGRLRALTFGHLPLKKVPIITIDTPLPSAIRIAQQNHTDIIAVKEVNGRFIGQVKYQKLLEETANKPPILLSNLVEPLVCVKSNESLEDYIDHITHTSSKDLAVFNTQEQFLGLVSLVAILHHYLSEVRAADEDEIIRECTPRNS